MDRNKYEELLGEAARRCARLSAPDCSETERAEHARWLDSDPDRRAAFEQIERASSEMDRALKLDQRLQRMAEQAFAAGAQEAKRERRQTPVEATRSSLSADRSAYRSSARVRRGFALAAAAAFVCVLAVTWRLSGIDLFHSSAGAAQTLAFEASARKPEHYTLPDGSIVHLDAGGRLRAKLSASDREIELLSGRAFFEVAHDASRPFAVIANDTRTVALGTKFEVRRKAAGAIVTLSEGSVAVSGARGGWKTRLQPGEQLEALDATAQMKVRNVDPQEVTDWSRGWLRFRDAPLKEVLSDINRYSAKQVVVADESLLQLRVAGSFAEGDAQSIVDAIAEVLPIRAVDGGNHEIILFKRYEN
jgi:transmembrane sensor